MITDIDTVLAGLLSPTGARWSLGPPEPGLSTSPTLGLVLHGVQEDVEARQGAWTDERDEQGRVVARRAPVRRYRLDYLLGVWAPDVSAEHALTGAALTLLATVDTVAPEQLTPALCATGQPVTVTVAHTTPRADLWVAAGIAPHPALAVQVIASLARLSSGVPAAPRNVDLGVARTPPPRSAPSGAQPRPMGRIREAGGGGS